MALSSLIAVICTYPEGLGVVDFAPYHSAVCT